jgi:hypothetical protein
MANMGYSQLKTKRIINNENKMSNDLLKSLLNMLQTGECYKRYACIVQKVVSRGVKSCKVGML